MGRWYWREWRTADHIALWASVWPKIGLIGHVMMVGFLLGGLWGLLSVARQGDDAHIRCVTAGVAIGMGAFLYAGLSVSSLAHSLASRLHSLEQRLEEKSRSSSGIER